jgi:CheY-like chemotaxis protein
MDLLRSYHKNASKAWEAILIMPVNELFVTRHMLQSLGCRVEVVADGQEALDALSDTPYDLIFMDCQMPVMDGYAATRILREKEEREAKDPTRAPRELHRTPIIALTAHAMQGDRERCLASGMDDYPTKPFSLDGLLNILKRRLPSRMVLD